jgi:CheY-like chemotaxis protein
MAEQYAYDLKRVGGYDTLVAPGGAEALDSLANEAIDCVILDLEMPGVDGFEVLRAMKERGDATPVIVYTGTGDYDRCVQAIKLGAYSFIDKSESMERVVREVENALAHVRLVAEVQALRRELGTESPLIGSSRVMQQLQTAIGRVAPIPSPVLISPIRRNRSSRSTVRRCLRIWWRASCSGTSAARSPAPAARARALSKWPRQEPCFSTRSASCHHLPRRNFCALSRSAR